MDKIVTILLVEDDDVDAMAIERSFIKHRIANPIIRAHDGKSALEMLRSNKVDSPYIILLDLNMPRMGGIEFLESIRKDVSLKRSVVFVLTTSKDDKDVVAAYDNFVAGYFIKEDSGIGFHNVVELLSGYWKIVHLPDKDPNKKLIK